MSEPLVSMVRRSSQLCVSKRLAQITNSSYNLFAMVVDLGIQSLVKPLTSVVLVPEQDQSLLSPQGT